MNQLIKTKEEIQDNLRQKIRRQEEAFAVKYMKDTNVPHSPNRDGYDREEIYTALLSIKEHEFPEQLRYMKNVLRSSNQSNPTTVTNSNDNNQFDAYQFLSTMQEPAQKYFTDASPQHSVIEQLTILYDDEFLDRTNGFDDEMCYEGADIYLDIRKQAIATLKSAFENRGQATNTTDITTDYQKITRMMTKPRFEYLSNLAQAFAKNPESEEVIDFVKVLPNIWHRDVLLLPCDTAAQLRSLREKYLKKA
jgi:hypothetical protein